MPKFKVFVSGNFAFGITGQCRVTEKLREHICRSEFSSFRECLTDLLKFLQPWNDGDPTLCNLIVMGFDEQEGRVRCLSFSSADYFLADEIQSFGRMIAGPDIQASTFLSDFYAANPRASHHQCVQAHVECYRHEAEVNECVSPESMVVIVTRDNAYVYTSSQTRKEEIAADELAEGTTYGRTVQTRLSAGKPLIDFSESIHLNKTIDNVGDGTTFKRLANVNADNTLHVSTSLIKQGSIASAGSNNFSYTATTTSITWSWGAFSVYGPDGTTYTFSSGSASAFTGLTASKTYHFGLYVTLATLTVHVALSTQSSGQAKETQAIIMQTFNADGNVAINVDAQANTPASGTGGGGGGGGGSCFSPNTKVKTRRGNVRFDALRPDDEVLTARDTWKRVLAIIHRPYKGEMLVMGGCEFVTPSHLFLTKDGWKPSAEVYPNWPRVEYEGTVWNAIIDADDDWNEPDTEHSYTLANGTVAHNPIT